MFALITDNYFLKYSLYWRDYITAAMTIIWAMRLGFFLAYRSYKFGDRRFDEAKENPLLYLTFWIVQAFWIYITILPSIYIILSVIIFFSLETYLFF